jgi:RNA polymerase sigma-70 factor (ECF subfamily)
MIEAANSIDQAVEELYRSDWGRIVSTLIARIGDFELAEDSAQEAFAAAIKTWRKEGLPQSPRAWIVATARHKAIDTIRRRERLREILADIEEEPIEEGSDIGDERLRLICTCCHPALALEAQVALTLRSLGGLTTDQIARAFLVPEPTMAQRLVRAKRKIRDAGIPYVVPDAHDMPERLDAILTVIYLIFNEGYSATEGDAPMRIELTAEAIRLARLMRSLMLPEPPAEVTALLALMLLHDSRRETRFSPEGELVLLEDQDRERWDRAQIEEALPLVDEALRSGPAPYAVQAAIAALHCHAESASETDWPQILQLYRVLEALQPSPVVSLNRAVALAMVSGPEAALPLLDELAGELGGYHLLHAVRADLLRRSGRVLEAIESYRRALELVTNESERRFLKRRLAELSAG